MDNYRAIQTFWESFGVDAYDEQTVFTSGSAPAYPHITYEAFSGQWEAQKTMSASLWAKSTSWAWLKQRAEEIRKAIGSGITMPVDGGIIWFRISNTPFAQVIASGSTDDLVKRILLTIEVEFLTTR